MKDDDGYDGRKDGYESWKLAIEEMRKKLERDRELEREKERKD